MRKTSPQTPPLSFYMGMPEERARRKQAIDNLAAKLGFKNAARFMQALADSAVIEHEAVTETSPVIVDVNGEPRTISQRNERVVYVRLRLPVE